MKKKIAFLILCAVLFAVCGSGDAQQTGKVFRIGFLDDSTASNIAVRLDNFRQELSKLGWIEGKNVTIEYRFAEEKLERLPELAADLVRRNVDLIVTTGEPPALAAKEATTTHRDGECCGPRRFWFHRQSGAAGRQCHGALESRDRAKQQKVRGTQGCDPEACPSWTTATGGRIGPPTQRT